jgi:hypothetical protein
VPETRDSHDWNALDTYFIIHDAYLQRAMDDGFVLSHNLSNPLVLPDTVVLRGRIDCEHGIFLDVDKVLEVMYRGGRPYVRTQRYNYQAMIVGSEPRPIFRYDNAHIYPGHTDRHHKHRVDFETWTYIEPPDWVGHEAWPHINEVIEELQLWWLEIGFALTP